MEMTFQQYVDNPLGRRNAAFSQREAYKAMFTDRFDKVLLREAGKINYTLYIDKKKDRYIIHIKVPSETVKDFYYDAVICFYTDDPAAHASSDLKNYYVKFFSNDPAFVFTYLRVFLKNDMFFEDMKPKSSKLALTKDPKIKNPYGIPGYSKIIYFAYLYMKMKNLFQKRVFNDYGKPYSAKELLNHVEHTDKKIADRQEAGEEQAVAQRAEVRREKHAQTEERREQIVNSSKNIKFTPSAKTTKTVGAVKKTPYTKRVSNKK